MNREVEVIQLKGLQAEEVDLSRFTTGMATIELETIPECMLGSITDLSFYDDFIYVRDNIFQGIYIFDNMGKFAGKLDKQGRGHGEYLNLSDFDIDRENNSLEVLDGSNLRILRYSLPSLEFIEEIPVPLSVCFRFLKKEGVYYFDSNGLRNVIDDKPTNSDLIAFDPNNKTLTPVFDKLLPDDVYRTYNIYGYSADPHKQFYFSRMWDDQFYLIEGGPATPILAVDAGPKDVPDRIKKGSYEQQQEFLDSTRPQGRFLFFRLSLYDPNKVAISFSEGNRPFTTHYYIRIGNDEFVAGKLRNDFMEGNPQMPINDSFFLQNKLIFILNPDSKQSPGIEKYLGNLGVDEHDNPVIMLFNIKD